LSKVTGAVPILFVLFHVLSDGRATLAQSDSAPRTRHMVGEVPAERDMRVEAGVGEVVY
jgi:hypothetical protein